MNDPSQVPGQQATSYGHTFTWTPQHPRIADVRKRLFTFDTLASSAIDRIDALSPPTPDQACPMTSLRDPYAILRDSAHSDPVLRQLWHQVTTPPDWVDWDQIARGQAVVYRYHGQMLLGLLFNSLLGGMAGWRVAETLNKTGGFSPQATRRRLLETAQHFHEVVRSLESIQPGGDGFISSVRVRLLHATVRRRILQIEHDHGNYYDLPAWGVPINDLHQLATVDVYSTALVYMSLPRQGVTLSRGEAADFLALWRWVGHVMGAPVDSLADPDGARRMFESVLVSEVDPSAKSAVLANNILTAQAGTPPLYASRGFLAAVAYRLNGEDMARRLRIDPPGVVDRALVVLQCWVLWVGSAVYPWLPRVLRERRDRRFIDNMKHYTMDKAAGGLGQPTKFPFKWRPAHGKTTPLAPYTSPKRTLHVSPAHLAVAGSVCLVVLGAVAAWLVHVLYPHAWHEVVVHKAPRFAVPSERVLRWRL